MNLERVSICGKKDSAIGGIEGKVYKIPSYQRGFRWGGTQISQLLKDVTERYCADDETPYLLQPIVLCPVGDVDGKKAYEVLDGQQRLTAIWLILHYLAERYGAVFGWKAVPYELCYDTRFSSGKFLLDLNMQTEMKPETIDEDHFKAAYREIDSFFMHDLNGFKPIEDGSQAARDMDWRKYFVSKVEVIWYEVDSGPGQNSNEAVFVSLNRGRIPLGNAELIKTLLLVGCSRGREGLEEVRQTEISSQWDEMERELQDDEFWAFIAGNEQQGDKPRLEYLFELLPDLPSNELSPIREGDDYGIFNAYADAIKSREQLYAKKATSEPVADFVHNTLWRQHVRAGFLKLRDWYRDVEMFHKIGYLIAVAGHRQKSDRVNLLKDLLGRRINKSEFRILIDERIQQFLNCKKSSLEELSWESNSADISRVLLLFNVISCMNEGVQSKTSLSEWYSFARHYRDNWTLEHINPRKEAAIHYGAAKDTRSDWCKWLSAHLPYLDFLDSGKTDPSEKLAPQAKKILSMDAGLIDGVEFQQLREKIVTSFNGYFDPEEENQIGNLALLDHSQNASLGASVFLVKRESIINMIAQGRFVPFCTRRVFLKYYTSAKNVTTAASSSFAYWTTDDASNYVQQIEKTLEKYFL